MLKIKIKWHKVTCCEGCKGQEQCCATGTPPHHTCLDPVQMMQVVDWDTARDMCNESCDFVSCTDVFVKFSTSVKLIISKCVYLCISGQVRLYVYSNEVKLT